MRSWSVGLVLLLAGCVTGATPPEPRCVVTPVGLVECRDAKGMAE